MEDASRAQPPSFVGRDGVRDCALSVVDSQMVMLDAFTAEYMQQNSNDDDSDAHETEWGVSK